MIWTKEKPTKPGWYWWRLHSGPTAYKGMREIIRHGNLLQWRLSDGDLQAIPECDGFWSGPIPPPEPQEA